MQPSPRPYQLRAIESLRARVVRGQRRVVLSLPTGGGKTCIASAIIHSARTNFDARVLFVAPLIQLINQTVDDLASWDLTDVGVLRGNDERVNPAAPIQVASIQTLARRDKPPADIVILDEAHCASAPIYREHIFDAYPEATIIGLSATPAGLAGCFGAIETASTYAELIADGWIAEPHCIGISPDREPDLSRVRTVAGEYNLGELEHAMLLGTLVGNIVGEWQHHAQGHRTVVFAVGVDHSKEIVRRFLEAGIPAEHIDASTPIEERKKCLRRLEDGYTRVVSNVGIFTMGWNQPSVRCCILARPTKSLVLYKQMVGRVLRVWQGVQPIVIDHAGCIDAHGMPHDDIAWTLGEVKRPPKNEYRMCKACFVYFRVTAQQCPQCGWVAPVVPREPPKELSNVALVARQKVDERRQFYDRQVERARAKGFKPGFAAAKYKEKFGAWPQWAWSQATKAAYAQDEAWQQRLAAHERERAYWLEQQAKKPAEPPPEDASAPEPEYEGEGDHAFADLLK